jgi:hypothetical protein
VLAQKWSEFGGRVGRKAMGGGNRRVNFRNFSWTAQAAMLGTVKSESANLRCAVRFPLHLPISILGSGKPDEGVTQDISAAGVLFHCTLDYPVGSQIQFSISMPAQALGADRDVQVECTGRVVRCTPVGDRVAVGAIIDEYHVAH